MIVGACGGTTASPSASGPPASAAASAAPSAAASPSAAAGESILRVARLADHYNFWHPVQFQTGNQFQWFSSVFNTLVEAEADSKTVVGDLAATFDVSPDASVYTFHLVDNAKWHDGEAFNADDVMFTINWTLQNWDAFKGFLPHWSQIKGAEAVAGTTNTPEGLKKIDDSTVEITLVAPNAGFLYSLTDMANMILPEHILKDVTKADVEKIDFTVGKPGVTIGTGPYKLTNFTADQSVELDANPDYFKGAPKIQKIIFKLFADPALAVAQLESGDLDLAFRVSPGEFDRLSAIPTLNAISAENPGIVRIVFQTETAPWSDKRVRQAFYTAINRQAIVDDFYKGRAKVLYNPPGFTVYDDLNKYDYNVDTAKQLLTDGGYKGETVQAPLQPDVPRRHGDHAAHPERPAGRRRDGRARPDRQRDLPGEVQRPDAMGRLHRRRWQRGPVPGSLGPVLPQGRQDRIRLHEPQDLRTVGRGPFHGRRRQAGRDLPRTGQDPQRGCPAGQPVFPEPRDGGLEAARWRLRHPSQRARVVHGRGGLDAAVAPRGLAPETDRGARRIPAGAAL